MKSKTSTKNIKHPWISIAKSIRKPSPKNIKKFNKSISKSSTQNINPNRVDLMVEDHGILTMTVRVSMDKDGNITSIERIRIGKAETSNNESEPNHPKHQQCKSHPKYTGTKAKPTGNCRQCWELWYEIEKRFQDERK
jgi:hypothetical protein